jgi:hypothetical protein
MAAQLPQPGDSSEQPFLAKGWVGCDHEPLPFPHDPAADFTSASSGDFTSSQWSFGDGTSGSTQANPTHTYAAAGTYTVALTVNDGVESDTLTRPAYVNVGYRVYLPTVTRKYDPFLYDDFNNPAYDGSYNYALWSFR